MPIESKGTQLRVTDTSQPISISACRFYIQNEQWYLRLYEMQRLMMKPDTQPPELATKAPIYLIAIPFLVGLAIALLSPLDVLKYAAPKLITEVASSILPTVRKMSKDYELAEVAKFYFSTMWLLSPVIFLYFYKELQSQAYKVVPRIQKYKLSSLFYCLLFFPAAGIFLTRYGLDANDVYDARTVMTLHSRWGMPIAGFILPAGASGMFAILAFYFKNIRTIFS